MSMYSALRDYLDLMEGFLAEKREDLHQVQTEYLLEKGYSLEDFESRTPEMALDLLVLEFSGEINLGYPYNIEREFPNLLRKSLFIIIYSFSDNNLHRRCNFIQHQHDLELSVTDLRGGGVMRSKEYLEKVAGFDFSDSEEWFDILSYVKLRNCVIHGNSLIEKCRYTKFLKSYVSSHRALDLDHSEVIFQKGFCEEVIDNFANFEEYLQEHYSAWLRYRQDHVTN